MSVNIASTQALIMKAFEDLILKQRGGVKASVRAIGRWKYLRNRFHASMVMLRNGRWRKDFVAWSDRWLLLGRCYISDDEKGIGVIHSGSPVVDSLREGISFQLVDHHHLPLQIELQLCRWIGLWPIRGPDQNLYMIRRGEEWWIFVSTQPAYRADQ